jgi:hypothetical protein
MKETAIFPGIYVGDIVVSLDCISSYRSVGDMFTVLQDSRPCYLYYDQGVTSSDSHGWRLATLEEAYAYSQGIKNIYQIKTNNMKQKKFDSEFGFAVRCNSWHLYNAFAEELKGLGYVHEDVGFNPWTIDIFKTRNCVWITDTWNSKLSVPSYSFSCTDGQVFNLETEWDDALEYAKQYLESIKTKDKLVLTSDYTANIDRENGLVVVGCQKIPFYKVNELYKLINKI